MKVALQNEGARFLRYAQIDDRVAANARAGVYPARKWESRNGCGLASALVLLERGPNGAHPRLEVAQRAFVVDDVVGAGPFERRRHLRGDHRHGVRLGELALQHQALEAEGSRSVDQHHSIELAHQMALEEQRNVADDDPVAALSSFSNQSDTLSLDLRMDDRIQGFELGLIGEHELAQFGAIEQAVGRQYRRPPVLYDLVVRRRSAFDGSPSENVGVDDRRPSLREELGDGGFARSDIAGESDE